MNFVMHKTNANLYIYRHTWINLLGLDRITWIIFDCWILGQLLTKHIYVNNDICMASRSFPLGAKTTFLYISCNVFGE